MGTRRWWRWRFSSGGNQGFPVAVWRIQLSLLARSLAAGRGFVLNGRPTAYRPPLYPIVLAPSRRGLGEQLAWGVAGLHLVLGAGTGALTAGSPRLAPGVVSRPVGDGGGDRRVRPFTRRPARLVMTETLTLLLAAALAALTARGCAAVLGGSAFGLAALCRPSTLAVAVLVRFAAAMLAAPGRLHERLARATILAAATAATLAPWACATPHVRRTRLDDDPRRLYAGAATIPVYYSVVLDGPPGAVGAGANQQRWFESVNLRTAGMTEPAADRTLRGSALQLLRDRPATSHVLRGRGWPGSGAWPPRASCTPGPRCECRLDRSTLAEPSRRYAPRGTLDAGPATRMPLVIIGLSAVHTVYWTDARMRAPAVPAIALVAAQGARTLVRLVPGHARSSLQKF